MGTLLQGPAPRAQPLHFRTGFSRYAALVAYMAWTDMQSRYKRSVLGPLWLTLGTAVGTLGPGILWSELLHMDRNVFIPPLTAGLIIWQFITGCITDGPSVLTRQASIIRNIPLPLMIHPVQSVVKHLINLLHNLPIFIIVVGLLHVPVNLNTLLVIPALALTVLNLLWASILLSMMGARFRDLEYLIGAVMPILMFLSPVMYRPSYLPFSHRIMWLNPFSHMIELIRYPMLGVPPPTFLIWTNLAMCVVGWGLAIAFFSAKRHRVGFWV